MAGTSPAMTNRETVVVEAIANHIAQTFAANRAVGGIALTARTRDGITRRARVHEHGSLRVRCPGAPAEELEAIVINSAGGMAGGDRFALDITAERGARARRDDGGGREGLSHARSRARTSRSGSRSKPAPRSPGCRRRPSCSTGRSCAARSRSISPTMQGSCSPKRSCSAAPAWARRSTIVRCSIAGTCGATAGSSTPKRCGLRARSPRKLARPAVGERRRRGRHRAGGAGRRRDGRGCARARRAVPRRGRHLGLEGAGGRAAVRRRRRGAPARSHQRAVRAARDAAAAPLA